MTQITEIASMPLSTIVEADWNGLRCLAVSSPDIRQTERIMAVFGPTADRPPKVSEDTLAQYHKYLSANLSLPFTAYYPQPMNAQEKTEFRCAVLDLLDPTQYLGDEFDGICCRTRKGNFEVNLPLIELHMPENSPNVQWIEDYWFWFWNWR
jgi:hypothetical protein